MRRARVKGARAGRPHLRRRCSPTSPTRPTRSASSPPTSSTTDDGTGVVHIAPGLRRGRPAGRRGGRHRAGRARSTTRAASPTRSPTGPAQNVFDANPDDHRRTSRTRGVVRPPRHLRPQLPALLAHRHADHLQGRVVLVRARSPTSATAWSSINQEINWIPDHVRDGAVRQVARGRPRLVDLAATASGARPSRCGGQRRPGVPAHRRVRLARRARGRLRRAARPTCTARSSTSSCAPTPTTPPAGR